MKLYSYEIEIYPEFEFCGNENAQFEHELSKEDFDFVAKAKNNWTIARNILFRTKKKIKHERPTKNKS